MSLVLMITLISLTFTSVFCIHQLRDGRGFCSGWPSACFLLYSQQPRTQMTALLSSNKTLINSCMQVWAQRYLDFLSGQRFDLSLLSDGEAVCQDFGSSGVRHFELISVLLDLRHALMSLPFSIRSSWRPETACKWWAM